VSIGTRADQDQLYRIGAVNGRGSKPGDVALRDEEEFAVSHWVGVQSGRDPRSTVILSVEVWKRSGISIWNWVYQHHDSWLHAVSGPFLTTKGTVVGQSLWLISPSSNHQRGQGAQASWADLGPCGDEFRKTRTGSRIGPPHPRMLRDDWMVALPAGQPYRLFSIPGSWPVCVESSFPRARQYGPGMGITGDGWNNVGSGDEGRHSCTSS
jgi:hypothetical protein